MANATTNINRPVQTGFRGLEIIQGLLGAGVEAFQGVVLGRNASGYYVNADNTLGGLRALAVVRRYATNVGGADGAAQVELERGVHAFDTWSGTIDQKSIGEAAVIGADNQTIALLGTPSAVQLVDANCMSLTALRPGVTFKAINEGASKPLTFRVDKPGEITISLKTTAGSAVDSTMTGTAVVAALNASPLAGPLALASVLGTGNTVLTVLPATNLSGSRLGEIVRVESGAVYVDSTK